MIYFLLCWVKISLKCDQPNAIQLSKSSINICNPCYFALSEMTIKIILCEHNNFVVINFIFLKNKIL
jgi:hypothetical protein